MSFRLGSRDFSLMIFYAIVLHFSWATLALYDRSTYGGTAISLLYATFGIATPFVLYAVASLAFSAFFVKHPALGLILQSPQQYVLAISALAVLSAVWSAQFADGVIRARAFILADQLPAIIAFCGHTAAMFQMAVRKNGMRPINSLMMFLISGAIVGPIAWIALDRNQPVARITGTVAMRDGSPIYPGESVVVDWTITATKSCAGSVRRQIVDGQGVTWDFNVVPAVAEAGPNQPYHLIREIAIPKGFGFPPGATSARGHYHAALTWHCNFVQWLWPVQGQTDDVEFTVYKPAQP